MRTDDCQPACVKDIQWLFSPAGLQWGMGGKPTGSSKMTPGELEIIHRRIKPFTAAEIPYDNAERVAQELAQRGHTAADLAERGASVWHYLWIWEMPFYHTKYMSELNAYHSWLMRRRPWFTTWVLSDYILQQDMYKVCRAIANERKALRLKKLRKLQ
jgi:hypothetical protein